jgi:hypothetical protein
MVPSIKSPEAHIPAHSGVLARSRTEYATLAASLDCLVYEPQEGFAVIPSPSVVAYRVRHAGRVDFSSFGLLFDEA